MDSKLVHLPPDWRRIIITNKKCVIFCRVLLKNDLTPYFERSVIIDEDTTITCKYLNSIEIDITQSELNSNVLIDPRVIENLILNFSNATICSGTFIPNELMKYKPNTGYTDCNVKFHHSKCLFVIKTSSNNNSKSEKCKFCVTLISTCNKKNTKKFKGTKN